MSEQSTAQLPSGRTRRRRSDDHLFLSKFVRCRAALVELFWLTRSYLSKKKRKKEEQVSIASTTQVASSFAGRGLLTVGCPPGGFEEGGGVG